MLLDVFNISHTLSDFSMQINKYFRTETKTPGPSFCRLESALLGKYILATRKEELRKEIIEFIYCCLVKGRFEGRSLLKEVMNPTVPRKSPQTPLKGLPNKPKILDKKFC